MHQNKHCPSRIDSFVSAVVDMWTLAQCHSLVRSKGSTFSYISELLRIRRFERLVRLS
jgi:hypothetical protein